MALKKSDLCSCLWARCDQLRGGMDASQYRSKGQFSIPAEVSRILATVVGIGPNTRQDQTVYDPARGSGSLPLEAAAEAPKAGANRLRRMKDDGSDTYKSVQRGAMTFVEGVFAGIRNPLSHEVGQELSEQESLEYLSALSVLARWVDQSDVEAAS